MYLKATEDLLDDEFVFAVEAACRGEKFFPLPATLTEYAKPLIWEREAKQRAEENLQIRQQADAQRKELMLEYNKVLGEFEEKKNTFQAMSDEARRAIEEQNRSKLRTLKAQVEQQEDIIEDTKP